jgi:hypothetical protein
LQARSPDDPSGRSRRHDMVFSSVAQLLLTGVTTAWRCQGGTAEP